jgi:TolA-binding protein
MGEGDMNEDMKLLDPTLQAIATDQDRALAEWPRSTDAIAEEAMRRAWNSPRHRVGFRYAAVAGLAATVAFAVAFFVLRTSRRELQFEVAGRSGQPGATVTAQAGSPLPLQFSDGSKLVFQPGAMARVAHLTDSGAELLLETGRLIADIRHTGQAHWSVTAGPFKVVVTGTRFGAEWSPSHSKLMVEMFEGSTIVQGPSLGDGQILRAGETLEVGASSLAVVTRTVTAPAPTAADPVAHAEAIVPAPAPAPALAPRPQTTWSDLAASGRYGDALAAAEREGFAHLCRQLDAGGLLSLGDAARYALSPKRARQAFEALVRRFPRDQQSLDALFALGRLESEVGEPMVAAHWFERYLVVSPTPPLAEEAAGRLVEIYDRSSDHKAAMHAARVYLDRHPEGPRAGLAHKTLAAHEAAEVTP